jgi:hypothetical protein
VHTFNIQVHRRAQDTLVEGWQSPSFLRKVSLQGCAYAGKKGIDLGDEHKLTF